MPVNIAGEKVQPEAGWRIIFFIADRTVAFTDKEGNRISFKKDDKKDDKILFDAMNSRAICADIATLIGSLLDLDPVKEKSDDETLVFLLK